MKVKAFFIKILSLIRKIGNDPNDAYSWNNKGVALSDLGRKEDAQVCFDTAEELKNK